MKNNYFAESEQVIGKAIRIGADAAEVYIINSQDLSIEVANGQIETMKNAQTVGMGIRVMKSNKMGYAFSTDLSKIAVDHTVHKAVANAAIAGENKHNVLPRQNLPYRSLAIYDPEIETTKLNHKIQLAKDIEISAKAEDSRITIIENCTYQDSVYSISLVNSNGIQAYYEGSYCGGYAFLVGEDQGDSQTGFSFQYKLKISELDPQIIGKEAAQKAIRMLGAKEVPTQRATVIFDPYIVTSFLGVLAPSLSAEAVQKGRSIFAGKVGETVASVDITLVDDGALDGGIASAPFDGEGVPTQRTVLINKGTLLGYLHNTYTASKEGTNSTGNGVRDSFKSTPEINTTNFYFDKGPFTKEDLFNGVEKGLYVTDVMGMHTANPISGDFSVGAAGIWIERGELKGPVRGIAIAGNLLSLLKSINGVADNLTFFLGKGAPSVRIEEMTISGS
ncbi:MAG: TldD/PmbA family protein [Bacillota bacterium]